MDGTTKIIFVYGDITYTPTEFCDALKKLPVIYHGKLMCQSRTQKGKKCTNKAYYKQRFSKEFKYVRGQHSDKNVRTPLPKDRKRAENRKREIEEHLSFVESYRLDNSNNNLPGKIECRKMYMMKRVLLKYGYLNVFPNNRHQSRKDGFGCASLSPMRLGPVDHGQPGLPKAKNIENFHQFSKCWPNEVEDGEPTDEWRERRVKGYDDPVPHRHKFDAKVMKELRRDVNGQNRNAPLFSVFLDKNGIERKFSYVECRYFYCKAYEVLALHTDDYKKLKKMIAEGTNIVICGYDAQNITNDLYTHYCDPTKPFGHEMVLYTLLTSDGNYPWDIYRKNHNELYKGMTM